jgi:hypothetical protein
MKRAPRLLIAFAVSIMALPAARAEEPRVLGAPLQGVVVHGRALAMCEFGSSGIFGLRHARLAGGPARDGAERTWCLQAPPRVWQVAHGYLWASANRKSNGLNDIDDSLYRYRLGGFLEDKWITSAEVDEDNLHYGCFIGLISPLGSTRSLHLSVEYDLELYYDHLPTAEDAVLLFQLCNVAGADHSGLPATPDSEIPWRVTPLTRYTDDEHKKPHWSLAVFGFKNKWDAKAKNWPRGKWERLGVIEGCFHEQFRVLGKGDDYYFVTDSGKLFRAPKPDKGGDRKMEAVWDDEKRPVAAFITDADADRSFLFCKPDKDGKGVYFEMSDKPDPQPYDASKIAEAKVADQLPAVLAYVKVLLADKKIKDKE